MRLTRHRWSAAAATAPGAFGACGATSSWMMRRGRPASPPTRRAMLAVAAAGGRPPRLLQSHLRPPCPLGQGATRGRQPRQRRSLDQGQPARPLPSSQALMMTTLLQTCHHIPSPRWADTGAALGARPTAGLAATLPWPWPLRHPPPPQRQLSPRLCLPATGGRGGRGPRRWAASTGARGTPSRPTPLLLRRSSTVAASFTGCCGGGRGHPRARLARRRRRAWSLPMTPACLTAPPPCLPLPRGRRQIAMCRCASTSSSRSSPRGWQPLPTAAPQ